MNTAIITKSCSAINLNFWYIAKWRFLLAFCGDWRESTALSRCNLLVPSLDLTASPVIQWTWPTYTTSLHKVLPAQAALALMPPKKKANPKSNSDEYITSESATSLTTRLLAFWRTNGAKQDSLHPILPSRKILPVPPRPSEVWLSFRTREEHFYSEDSVDSTLHSESWAELPRSEQLTTWYTKPKSLGVFMCREFHSTELNFVSVWCHTQYDYLLTRYLVYCSRIKVFSEFYTMKL